MPATTQGEQIYLRENFKELIETQAVNVIGPDAMDVGGLRELKVSTNATACRQAIFLAGLAFSYRWRCGVVQWIAEYADLHGIQMAPHGTGDGLLGVAALVQMSAALPSNFIAFEYCGSLEDPATGRQGQPVWWKDILDGLPDPIVKDGFIDVWDAPGLGVTFNAKAREHLPPGDEDFFDPVLGEVAGAVKARHVSGSRL